jgi:hypothetical protein
MTDGRQFREKPVQPIFDDSRRYQIVSIKFRFSGDYEGQNWDSGNKMVLPDDKY